MMFQTPAWRMRWVYDEEGKSIEVSPREKPEPSGIYIPDGKGDYVKVSRPPRKLGFGR